MSKTKPEIPTPPTDSVNTEIPKAPMNPRDEMLSEIAESRAQERKLKLADEGVETLEEIEEVPQELDNAETHLDTKLDSSDLYLDIVVDGTPEKVSHSDAIAKLQKLGHADNMMRGAVKLNREAEDKLALAKSTPTQPDASGSPEDFKSTLKDALTKMYDDGDIDTATEVLAQALTETKTVDITEQVTKTVAKLNVKSGIKDAYDSFAADKRFAHLVEDTTLLGRVDDNTVILQNDAEFMDTKPSNAQIFEKAGEMTLDWIDSLNSKNLSEQDPTTLDLKRNLPKATPAITARRSTPQPAAPKTTKDVIADIAKARGQTVS